MNITLHRTLMVCVLAATMAIVAVLAAGTASADPVNSKNVEIVTFDCGDEQLTVTFLLNPSSIFSVVGTTSNFVLTGADGTATFTDPETGLPVVEQFVYRVGQGERTGQQGSLTTCDTTITLPDEGLGPVTVDYTFIGFFTPREG
jgi:hypothetical protein